MPSESLAEFELLVMLASLRLGPNDVLVVQNPNLRACMEKRNLTKDRCRCFVEDLRCDAALREQIANDFDRHAVLG